MQVGLRVKRDMELSLFLDFWVWISLYLVVGAYVSYALTVHDIRERHARYKYWRAKLDADLKRYYDRLVTADADERNTKVFLIETAKQDLLYEKDQLYNWRFKIVEGFIWPISLVVHLIDSEWGQKKSRQFSDWVLKFVNGEDSDGF